MSVIKSAGITDKGPRSSFFHCEFQFTPEQVGQTFLLNAEYYARQGRIGKGFGPFPICSRFEVVPDTEDYSIQFLLEHPLDPKLHYRRIEAKLIALVDEYLQDWPK